jgi:hypothetical protein
MSEFVGVTAYSHVDLNDLKQQALLFDRVAIPGLNAVLEQDELYEGTYIAELSWIAESGVIFEAQIDVNLALKRKLMRVERRWVEEPNYFTRLTAEYMRNQLSVDAVALEGTEPLISRMYKFTE